MPGKRKTFLINPRKFLLTFERPDRDINFIVLELNFLPIFTTQTTLKQYEIIVK